MTTLETISNHLLSTHPDLLNTKDELDVQDFLEEHMLDLSMPTTSRFYLIQASGADIEIVKSEQAPLLLLALGNQS